MMKNVQPGQYNYDLYRENDEALIFNFQQENGDHIDIAEIYDDVELRVFCVNRESNPVLHFLLSDGTFILAEENVLIAEISSDETVDMMNIQYYLELRTSISGVWQCYLTARIEVKDSATGTSSRSRNLFLKIPGGNNE